MALAELHREEMRAIPESLGMREFRQIPAFVKAARFLHTGKDSHFSVNG